MKTRPTPTEADLIWAYNYNAYLNAAYQCELGANCPFTEGT